MANIFKRIIDERCPEVAIWALFLLTYIPTLHWMWDRWFAKDTYYSHGILVPFVTGYFIWQKRSAWRRFVPKSSPWGMFMIILGLLIHVASSLFRVYFTSAFSMLIVVFGIALYFYGAKIVRCVLFPLGFLIFMIPLPLVVVVNLSFNMKLLAAEIAEKILGGMGLVAMRTGSIIRMRHAYVIVDDLCSGLRSLMALMALGSIFAYWLKGNFSKKCFLFLLTIPIAVVTNVCRIVVLAAITDLWGPEYTVGFIHTLTGLMVFALAFFMMLATSRLIE